jgi:DNA-binding transcriptional regulator GbsR (MarR family)
MVRDVSPERQYAEEAGMVLAGMGMPPAYGKLLGWLLICDPPSQSSVELAEALGLSKGSVSTGMRMLERSRLVRRVAVPGRRGHFYEMAPDAFLRAVEDGSPYRMMRELLERGLRMLGDEQAPRAERLRETRDFYAFIERELPRLIEDFTKRKGEGDG